MIGQGILLALVAVFGLPGLASLPPQSSGRWITALVGLALLVAGSMVGFAGARQLGRSLTAVPRPRHGARLVDSGIYGVIRHPLYLALMLIGAGWAVVMVSIPSAIVAAALTAWLDAKSRREEAWLLEAYQPYAAYRQRTARFVPGLY